ncbi:unnamed protein product [Angiostrongylus costaricensis]|uniref:CYTH domain-containing protein n=1 Tax=Angiostrongylus costaricensis TaxID=334426 RepID=A0A0R3PQ55_ANGCS|nr:unnamed protein product [Angiostrongylus costaricensis]
MLQSVVLKARVDDLEEMETLIFDLTDSLGTFFVQEDVYFNVPNGNLKLRIMHPNTFKQHLMAHARTLSEMMVKQIKFYQAQKSFCGVISLRPNNLGIALDSLLVVFAVFLSHVSAFKATLGAALGERGAITKKRRVFTMDDVRIYLDDVANIGQFIDITVSFF